MLISTSRVSAGPWQDTGRPGPFPAVMPGSLFRLSGWTGIRKRQITGCFDISVP